MTRSKVKPPPGARKAKLPGFISPQLANLVKEPPSGDEWLHELKFDGYRMLCRVDRGRVTVWSRNGKDWTEKFQNVVEAVKSLKATSAMLDGEIVIVDAQGRSSFQKLQRAMGKSHDNWLCLRGIRSHLSRRLQPHSDSTQASERT